MEVEISHAVLTTASSSPSTTPSKRFVTRTASAVMARITASPRCSRHSGRSSLTGTSLQPACTRTPASAASGMMPIAAGSSAANSSSHRPCRIRESEVRAPAWTLAALRTMTAVIGSAPSAPQTVFPTPCAMSSLL